MNYGLVGRLVENEKPRLSPEALVLELEYQAFFSEYASETPCVKS